MRPGGSDPTRAPSARIRCSSTYPLPYWPASAYPRGDALRALSALNVVAFLVMLVVIWIVAVRTGNGAWGPGLVLAVLAGPLLFYANATFGEMLAAFLIVLFAAAVLLGSRPSLIIAATWLAGITKETAAPFLLALGLAALLARSTSGRPPVRPLVWALVAGVAAAVATNGLFNVFRYGTPLNRDYRNGPLMRQLGDVDSVPLLQRVEYFGSLLFSPNGGLFVFWPTAAALLLLFGGFAVRSWRRREAPRNWLPTIAVLATFLALTAAFASWFAPFGWFGWGPRLTIPWIPGMLLLVVVIGSVHATRLARLLTRSWPALLLTSGLVWATAVPHFAFLGYREAFTNFFRSTAVCPFSTAGGFRGEMYFTCMDHLAWHEDPVLLEAMRGLTTLRGALLSATFLVAAVSLLTLMRDALAPARSGSSQEPPLYEPARDARG